MIIDPILKLSRCWLTFDALFSFSFLWLKIIDIFSQNNGIQESLPATVFKGAISSQDYS